MWWNAGNGDNEDGMELDNVSGNVSVQHSTFNNVAEEMIEANQTNTNLTLTVNDTTFTQPNTMAAIGGASAGAFAGNGVLYYRHRYEQTHPHT